MAILPSHENCDTPAAMLKYIKWGMGTQNRCVGRKDAFFYWQNKIKSVVVACPC